MGIQGGLTFALKIIAPPLQIRFIDNMYKLSAFYNKQINQKTLEKLKTTNDNCGFSKSDTKSHFLSGVSGEPSGISDGPAGAADVSGEPAGAAGVSGGPAVAAGVSGGAVVTATVVPAVRQVLR